MTDGHVENSGTGGLKITKSGRGTPRQAASFSGGKAGAGERRGQLAAVVEKKVRGETFRPQVASYGTRDGERVARTRRNFPGSGT
jgi:hypothetical protein